MDDVFDRFYKRHLSLVRATALARAGEAAGADDLTQETMLAAWRDFAWLQNGDDDRQRAWLLTTLRNRSIDAWRRRRPTVISEREPTVCDTTAPLRLDVARALSTLGDTDRELIVLRYFEQLDSPEIGRILDLPDGTVRRRLGEARQKLAARLAAWETDR
jgi:RNA polymerase sigma-70 factor (ECF subfamily)